MKSFFRCCFLLSSMFLCTNQSLGLTIQEKTKIVSDIYDRVYAVLGTAHLKPIIKMDQKALNAAYYSKTENLGSKIVFEELAFDVCSSFGARRDDAIAFLLGHELSHHMYKHTWMENFKSKFKIDSLSSRMDKSDSSLLWVETQADQMGGVFCYLAGYDPRGLVDPLFRKLYADYGYRADLRKYPYIEERIHIAHTQDSIISNYINIYETATYAMLIQEYDIAINCFNYVLNNDFQSKEVYNNLGVAYFFRAMKAEEDIDYLFPIEIDLYRDRGGSSKGFGSMNPDFASALEMFLRSTQLDNTYSTGYLNAACIYTILKQYNKAIVFCEDALLYAEKDGNSFGVENAQIVMAIMNHQNPKGDKVFAKKTIDELVLKGSDYAKYNQAVMGGKSVTEVSFSGKPLGTDTEQSAITEPTDLRREKLNGVEYSSLQNDSNFDKSIQYYKANYTLLIKDLEESVVTRVSTQDDDLIIFHSTKFNYKGEMSKKLKVGSTKSQLFENYGFPTSIFNSRNGKIYFYSKSQMFVSISDEDCIESWVIYRLL